MSCPMQTLVTRRLNDVPVSFQILDLGRQFYVWVGTATAKFSSVSVSFPPKGSAEGATTTLLAWGSETPQEQLAKRITSKIGVPVMLSLNVPHDRQLLMLVEKELRELLLSSLQSLAIAVSPEAASVSSAAP